MKKLGWNCSKMSALFAIKSEFALVITKQCCVSEAEPCVLQSPAVAIAILIGLFQLLLPAIAFFNDMRPHIMGFRQNPLVPVVILIAILFWGLQDIIGQGLVAEYVLLNTLPANFRYRALGFAVVTFAIIKVLLIVTRWATLTHRLTAAQLRLRQWRVTLRSMTRADVAHAMANALHRARRQMWRGLTAIWLMVRPPADHVAQVQPPATGARLDRDLSLRDRFSLEQ